MTTLEVLTAGRDVQARRGYDYNNGDPNLPGPCCPGACVAAVLGLPDYADAVGHPAAVAVAHALPEAPIPYDPDDVSDRLASLDADRGRCLSTAEVLSAWDGAIRAEETATRKAVFA